MHPRLCFVQFLALPNSIFVRNRSELDPLGFIAAGRTPS